MPIIRILDGRAKLWISSSTLTLQRHEDVAKTLRALIELAELYGDGELRVKVEDAHPAKSYRMVPVRRRRLKVNALARRRT